MMNLDLTKLDPRKLPWYLLVGGALVMIVLMILM